jgi:hypothetical protein
MRIWYVVGQVEYWLEPEYQTTDDRRFRVLGCKLYSSDNKYKGYWNWTDIPLVVKRQVREAVYDSLNRTREAEKAHRVYVKGHYRNVGKRK